jgi:hypothetical protein
MIGRLELSKFESLEANQSSSKPPHELVHFSKMSMSNISRAYIPIPFFVIIGTNRGATHDICGSVGFLFVNNKSCQKGETWEQHRGFVLIQHYYTIRRYYYIPCCELCCVRVAAIVEQHVTRYEYPNEIPSTSPAYPSSTWFWVTLSRRGAKRRQGLMMWFVD